MVVIFKYWRIIIPLLCVMGFITWLSLTINNAKELAVEQFKKEVAVKVEEVIKDDVEEIKNQFDSVSDGINDRVGRMLESTINSGSRLQGAISDTRPTERDEGNTDLESSDELHNQSLTEKELEFIRNNTGLLQ